MRVVVGIGLTSLERRGLGRHIAVQRAAQLVRRGSGGVELELLGLAILAAQPRRVLDRVAGRVDDIDGLLLTIGEAVAVHALEEQVAGELHRPRGLFTAEARVGQLDDVDRAVASPVAPGLPLRRGDVVIVVVPGRLATVPVLVHLRRCATGLVDHRHLADQVPVPPAEAGAVAVRPPAGETGLGVGVSFALGEVVDRAAVGLAVVDLHPPAELIGDRGDAQLLQLRYAAPRCRVHAVRRLATGDHDRRQGLRARTAEADLLELLQPQRRTGPVGRLGERVGEVHPVDVDERITLVALRRHRAQQLAGEEARRLLLVAGATSGAHLVHRYVGVRRRVVVVERRAGARAVRRLDASRPGGEVQPRRCRRTFVAGTL